MRFFCASAPVCRWVSTHMIKCGHRDMAQGLLTALMFKSVLWLLPAKLVTHLTRPNTQNATLGRGLPILIQCWGGGLLR